MRAHASLIVLVFVVQAALAKPPVADVVALETIMADPDWIGRAPERPYWSDDGRFIYYQQKRTGESARDLFRVDVESSDVEEIPWSTRGMVDHPGGIRSTDGHRRVFTRNGNLFVKDVDSNVVRQLTRSSASISGVRFMIGEESIMLSRGGAIVVRDLDTGVEYEPASVRSADDPDEDEDEDDKDYLTAQQERLFEIIRRRAEREEEAKEERQRREADTTRVPRPWYFGKKTEIHGRVLSPRGDTLLVRYAKGERSEGKADTMPEFVTDDGYVETDTVREKVGTGGVRGDKLALLDLGTRVRHDIDLSGLPGIADDPLLELREAAAARKKAKAIENDEADDDTLDSDDTKEDDNEPTGDDVPKEHQSDDPSDEASDDDEEVEAKPRPVRVSSISYSDDGAHLIFQAFSHDHKDRWIARIDVVTGEVIPIFHEHDEAWINRRFARLGWLPQTSTVYYQAESTGYTHVSVHDVSQGDSRVLTSGRWEVSSLRPSRDGRQLYFISNELHPGRQEVCRVDVATGVVERLTDLGGRNRFVLSPDESKLAILHSTTTRPPELYVQALGVDATRKRLTDTVSDAYAAIPWVEPEIVEVPSRHGTPIYARLYRPQETGPPGPGLEHPAVVFIHGAGYLQNAHEGWSGYFREFMFHTLLVGRGYVVLDMDYRASAGYGRDWRTAIYQRMGEPELEDLADGVAYLAETCNVDPARVGTYGGSYGGFLTLMALFQEPELFACGAALRPVTDWAHYNHGYTSNILNTPDIDPEAYERSSPIEYADGLARPLLMCHGMLDDNVLFQDTVRLTQRLIELRKENWEVALYPIEPHGFREPESWLDEYRRILKLFEENLWR